LRNASTCASRARADPRDGATDGARPGPAASRPTWRSRSGWSLRSAARRLTLRRGRRAACAGRAALRRRSLPPALAPRTIARRSRGHAESRRRQGRVRCVFGGRSATGLSRAASRASSKRMIARFARFDRASLTGPSGAEDDGLRSSTEGGTTSCKGPRRGCVRAKRAVVLAPEPCDAA
jgi:hypothetical protein